MTERERVLWCAMKYAHAVDDEESTRAVLSELAPRIIYMSDTALWEMRKAIGGYLNWTEQRHPKFVSEWTTVLKYIDVERSVRQKKREGEA